MAKAGDKLTIGGVPVTVISDTDAEQVDYIVCVPAETPSEFIDNLTAFCCECGCKVIHRWHAPIKPPKICIDCACKLANKLGRVTESQVKRAEDK